MVGLGVKYTRWGVQIHQNTGVFDLGTDTQKDTTAVDLFCGPQIHKIHSEFSPTPNTQNTDITPRVTVVTSAVASRHGPAPGLQGRPDRGEAELPPGFRATGGLCSNNTIRINTTIQYNTYNTTIQQDPPRIVLPWGRVAQDSEHIRSCTLSH